MTDYYQTIPFDKIVRFGHTKMLNSDVFNVSWILGRFCNYKCSYCWTHGRGDKKDHRPTDLCLSTIDEIKRQARLNGFNSFSFSLSGGEPTFHPGFLDIVKHLADDVPNCNRTAIHKTSNFSHNMKWYEKFVDVSKPIQSKNATASYHREHVNTDDKRKLFADKICFLLDNDFKITINIVMVPQIFYQLYEEAQYFYSRGIHVTLKPQSIHNASAIVDGYTEDMYDKMQTFEDQTTIDIEMYDSSGKQWMFDTAERFNAFGFNKFKGWKCHAGYQSIIIREPDGNIKRAYGCQDKPLGHIETGFNLFPAPHECISPVCISSADSKIPKFR